MAFDNSALFNRPNDCPYQPFVPYDQFDLDILLKVTAAIYNLNLGDFNCDTNLPQ